MLRTRRYMNMGYWKDARYSLHEACEAMALFVGELAEFNADDQILDVGCGLGGQDIFWMDRFSPARIVGLDVAKCLIDAARKRVSERTLADRIVLRVGSGTRIPFDASIFDTIVSMESAFHFATRVDFFTEAFRVLRPGGRLVVTDIIPLAQGESVLRHVSPRANLYPRCVYGSKLESAGFSCVQVCSIRDQVCLPYSRHMASLLEDEDSLRQIGPVSPRMARVAADPRHYDSLDYVVATAIKRA